MLPRELLDINYVALDILCRYGFYPYEFNTATGVLKPTGSRWRLYSWRARVVLLTAYFIHKILTGLIPAATEVPRNMQILTVLILYLLWVLLMVGVDFVLWGSGELVCFTVSRNHECKPTGLCGPGGKFDYGKYFGALRLVELLIVFLPIDILGLYFAIVGFYAKAYDTALSIYSSYPQELRGPVIFSVTTLLELYLIFELLAVTYFLAYFGLSFPVPHVYEDVLGSCSLAARKRGYSNGLRMRLVAVWLEVKIWNEFMSAINYGLKVTMMSMGTIGLFAGVQFRAQHPLIALIAALVGAQCVSLYVIGFGVCYLVSEGIREVKARLLKSSQRFYPQLRARIKRQLRCIREEGISMGGFYSSERLSTPIFVDFILQQVVDLLMTTSH